MVALILVPLDETEREDMAGPSGEEGPVRAIPGHLLIPPLIVGANEGDRGHELAIANRHRPIVAADRRNSPLSITETDVPHFSMTFRAPPLLVLRRVGGLGLV